MASNSSEPDPKVINSIVDRLKKQGLFDKFRKECLADVDTKPAYLNLRHRTEVAVARFLSTQTWHPALNKNQLRDSLRKHINESSIMSSGIDRVVEQVVNPKIYRVFKPQIDRVVCEFLGIDPDERERQLKLTDEEHRRQRMQIECNYLPGSQQQPFPPGTQTPDNSYGVGSSPLIPSLLEMRMPYISRGNEHIDSPNTGPVTPQMTVAGGSTVGASTSVTYQSSAPYGFPAGMQYGYPIQTGIFPGMTQQGMMQYPLGYSATMPPGFMSTIPQYPLQTMATDVMVAPPQVAQPLVAAPVEVSPVVVTETKEQDRKHVKKKKLEPLTVEELLNIPLPPKTHAHSKGKDPGKAEKKEEVGRQSPLVTETKDDIKLAVKRETSTKQVEETKSAVAPVAHPVEKMEVESHEVSSSGDISETKPKYSETVDRSKVKVERVPEKAQSRDVQKKVQEMPRQSNKASDVVKKPADGSSSTVTNTSDIKTETVKVEVEEESKKMSSQILDQSMTPEGKGCDDVKEGNSESKVYHFVWDNVDAGCISDATISSVHTSDLSSFDDGSDMTTRSSDDDLESKVTQDVVKEAVVQETDTKKETGAAAMVIEVPAEVATIAAPRQKPRRLISLQYNFSDSEEEESREERKARIAREIEERYLRRQQRRAELETKRREREDEKAVERQQRRRRRLAAAATAHREEAIKDAKDEEKKAEEKEEEEGGEVRTKKRDQHRTKEERKEELREQKVKEMRMALRRQRTRNRRYTSDDFTTFFSDNKCMRSNESYTKITSDAYSPRHDVKSPPTPTQDEHFTYSASHPSEGATDAPSSDQLSIPIYEATTPLMTGLSKFVHMTRSKTKQLTLDTGDTALEPGMPYSDVSSDALSFSGSSVDSKTHHSPSEGRQDQTSPHAGASAMKDHEKLTGRSDGDTPLSRVRRKSSGERQSSESRQKQCPSSDTSSTTSSIESTKANVQRYAVSDLYKPHHSRSRSSRHSSPLPIQREPPVRPSATDTEKRRAPPIDEVDFGEAAKKSLQQISFGEAERRSKAIRQRFGPPARHEVRRGSSSKSPSDRVERMPAREPTVPSGGTYWSARDEKYRETLKSSSTHGSWQSTKSSSQDDDDDKSRSKGRPRSKSQSEWRMEESPTKSERKAKRRKRRRKTDDSSSSGSEEYSNVSWEKRVSRSSSGCDDLDLYPASSSRWARPPRDDDESHPATRREEGETSDSDDDRSMSDDVNDTQEVRYTSEDLGQHTAENFYTPTLDTAGVDVEVANVAVEEVAVEGVECDGEMEVTVESLNSGDASMLQLTSATEQGEIQLEIWQGSSHWSLSVENVVPGTEMTQSVEMVVVQEPVSDVVTGDIVETIQKDDQVFYDESIVSCVDENINKGQKRPQSPDSDGESGPTKRARSDSRTSNEELVVAVQSQGNSTAPSPPAETTGEEAMCSPVAGFHTVPHIENPPPVKPEQRLGEEQSNILSEEQPSESNVSSDDEKLNAQAEVATETHDIVASGSLEVTDTQEDLPDASTDRHETPAEMGQPSTGSPDPQGISTVTAVLDAVEKLLPTPDRTGQTVETSEMAVKRSPPTPERTGENVQTPEKSSADQVSPTVDQSTTADGTLPTLSQFPVEMSPDLDETSPELDEILLLDETTPSEVIIDVTTDVVSVSASKGDDLPQSAEVMTGSVSPCAEEEQQPSGEEAQPESDAQVSPSDLSTKVAPEDPGIEAVGHNTESSPSPCRDEAQRTIEDMEVLPHHEAQRTIEDMEVLPHHEAQRTIEDMEVLPHHEAQRTIEDMEVLPHHEAQRTIEDMEVLPHHEAEPNTESEDLPAVEVDISETTKSENDDKDVDSEQTERGECEHDGDGSHDKKDTLLEPPSPSVKQNSEQQMIQAADDSMSLDNSVVISQSKTPLSDRPESLPCAAITDTVEPVAKILPKDDTQMALDTTEEKHPARKGDDKEEHMAGSDAKPTSSDAKSVDGTDMSPRPGASDFESSFDEDISETSAKGTETSDEKEETQEVSDTETLTPSVFSDTKDSEAKTVEPKQEDKESKEAGRRKSRRSVVEQQKDADIPDTDTRKSTALPHQQPRDRSQSMSGTSHETRDHSAGVTPPESSIREPRKLRRPLTPPPTRLRQQSTRNTGAVQQQPRSSSVGRRSGKVVTPPAKAVTPPKGKGKAGHIPMTRASRRKSEEASLPIAKRLRH